MKVRLLFEITMLVAIAAVGLQAQDTGVITGTVRDNSGAVIQGAEVTVTAAAGGNDRATTTNSDGEYLAAGLPGGTYSLAINVKGFKTYKVDNVVLRVAQKARVDATLAVGNVQTEIAVQGAEVNQVETESSDLAGTVTGRQMTQLELNGRNYTQLLSLSPGATNQSGSDENTGGLDSVIYSVNGGRTEYNNWEVDGGNNMDDGSNTTLLTFPSVDAIAEVRVLSSNYGAQYGRNSSGTVEVETKSGTNRFHGDAYEFVRNDAFNARNYFLSSVPPYKKNDFGYTVGGPVFIPNVYNQDRTKTFFFFSQEWRRNRISTVLGVAAVPSCAERGLGADCSQPQAPFGDFSELCPGTDCPINPATGNEFANDLVPIDPNALPLIPMLPQPNGGGPGAWTYTAAPATPTNWREELFRIDHNFNSRLHASVRYIHDSWTQTYPTPLWTNGTSFPSIQTTFGQPSTSLVVRLTATITPTLLNEFVASYSTNHITTQNIGAWKRPSGYNLGLFPDNGGKLPGIQLNGGIFDGLAEDAGWVPNGPVNSNPNYTYRDNVSKIIGNHNLQFGGYFVASQKNELPQFEPSLNGFAIFDTSFANSTGNAFADLLTGNIFSFQQASGQPKYYLRYKIFEPYFQDDWHVTKRLTLNLGLRISLFGTVFERYHQAYNFDPTKYVQGATTLDSDPTSPTFGLVLTNPNNGLVQCGVGGIPTGCAKGHLFNPAPRVGFAWDVFGNGRTALRGGYGIFFEHTNGNEAVATQLEGSPPLVQNPVQTSIATTFQGDTIQTSGYSLVGAFGAQLPQNVVSIPQKQVWPYMQQWNLNLQNELPWHIVTTAAYVGSKGTHLGRRRDLNQIPQFQPNTNPYGPHEAIGPDDCSTGLTQLGGVPIPGYNPDAVPGDQTPGTIGVNMYVACGNDPDFFRPFLGFGSIRRQENAASSIYHALQLSAHRNVGGLQLSAAYTYSHAIDDASSGSDNSILDSYNVAANRASSNFDQRHVFSLSYIYDIPIFKTSGLAHTVLGGWQWSGITLVQTGTPFTVGNGGDGVVPGDNAGVANGVAANSTSSRPDLIGDPNTRVPDSGASSGFGPLLFNPGAFAAPRGLTFGNAPRNIVRNPRQTNFDMALFKRFPIHESVAFEFRAEAFNVFNHTEWGYIGGDAGSAAGNSPSLTSYSNSVGCYAGPNNTPNDPSCLSGGLLRPSTAHNGRILQLGLKFLF